MAFTKQAAFIGAHFWFVPVGTAFTSPSAATVSQNGIWPDGAEPLWPNWKLGIIESFDLDPKYGPREEILEPSPGAVQATDIIIPYAIPEIKFTTLDISPLAIQLALNTPNLMSGLADANPNAGGGPGVRGILKAQKYNHSNVLILNYSSWCFIQMQGSLKGAPKNMTKPEYIATLLKSVNNVGVV